LIEVADDCPAAEAQVPQARGAKKTKPVVEYEMLAKHRYEYTEEDIAFETYAVLHDIPRRIWPKGRQKFLSKRPLLDTDARPRSAVTRSDGDTFSRQLAAQSVAGARET
jgi:hypothetical protein